MEHGTDYALNHTKLSVFRRCGSHPACDIFERLDTEMALASGELCEFPTSEGVRNFGNFQLNTTSRAEPSD